MDDDGAAAAGGIAARLRGAVCAGVAHDGGAGTWTFAFGGDRAVLLANCPWRIVAEGRIARARGDHGQWLGLPAPVDAVVEGARLLADRLVAAVVVRPDTAGLAIAFGGGIALQLFNDSAGFEGWEIGAADGFQVVAMDGDRIVLWDARKPPAGAAP